MNDSDDILQYSRYLLVIAHPDDEVNCAALLQRLLRLDKAVRIIQLTDGDAGRNAAGRSQEMTESAAVIGLPAENLIFLNISEKELLANASNAKTRVLEAAREFAPDCVLSLDYEGGHEGHDMACYLAHCVANMLRAPLITYPDYHFRNMQRYGLEFVPGRQADYTLPLSDGEKELKIDIIEAHRGQVGFFMRMQKRQNNYFNLLLEREIYRNFPADYGFLKRPDYQIGYEYHRNGFKFDDFVRAITAIDK